MVKINKSINVLSLFDGMSCGQIALERASIRVDKYYASEIKESSIKITQKNYPNTIQLGDVELIDDDELSKLETIDLLIAGSPCKNLTFTVVNNGNHNQGLKGEHSKLFYEYVRILDWIRDNGNPNVKFMLENVESMKDKDRDIISSILKVEPIMINSNLVSAQDRKRYYWTNIKVDGVLTDKGITLSDIMLSKEEVSALEVGRSRFWQKETFDFHGDDKKIIATLHLNGHDIIKRVYNPNNKCGTLTAVTGGNHQKKVYQDGRCRKLTPLEYERLQNVPEGYTEGVSNTNRWSALGDGWTIDVIVHIFKGLL